MFIYKRYYIPRYKDEYVSYLGKRYPEDRPKFKRMKKSQLKAIYVNIREEAR